MNRALRSGPKGSIGKFPAEGLVAGEQRVRELQCSVHVSSAEALPRLNEHALYVGRLLELDALELDARELRDDLQRPPPQRPSCAGGLSRARGRAGRRARPSDERSRSRWRAAPHCLAAAAAWLIQAS